MVCVALASAKHSKTLGSTRLLSWSPKFLHLASFAKGVSLAVLQLQAPVGSCKILRCLSSYLFARLNSSAYHPGPHPCFYALHNSSFSIDLSSVTLLWLSFLMLTDSQRRVHAYHEPIQEDKRKTWTSWCVNTMHCEPIESSQHTRT